MKIQPRLEIAPLCKFASYKMVLTALPPLENLFVNKMCLTAFDGCCASGEGGWVELIPANVSVKHERESQ